MGTGSVEPALDGCESATGHAPCPAIAEPATKRAGSQRAVACGQRLEVEFGPVLRTALGIGQQPRGLLFEIVLVLSPARRDIQEMVEGPASERGLDGRQHRRAQAAPRVAGREIGRILGPRDASRVEKAPQLGARGAEQRADQGRPHLAHSGQPAKAGAAQKTEQHGLDLVVAGVPEQDEAAAFARGDLLQRSVAPPPQRVLVAAAGIERGAVERGAASLGRCADQRRLAGRLRPEAVVDARHVKGQAEPRRQQPRDLEEGHRVASPGHADEHRLAGDAGPPQHTLGARDRTVHEEGQGGRRHRGPIMPLPRLQIEAPGWKEGSAFVTIAVPMNDVTKRTRAAATATISILLMLSAVAAPAAATEPPTPAPGQQVPAHAAGGWPTATTGDNAKPARTAEQQAAIDAVANELKRLANEYGPDSVVLQAKFLIRAMGAGAMGPTEVRVAGPSPGVVPAHLEIDIETGLYFDGRTTTAESRRDTVWKDVAVPVLDEMVTFKIEPSALELVFLFDVQEVEPGLKLDPSEPARHEAFRVRLTREVLEDLIADRLAGDAVREKVVFTEPATVDRPVAPRTP